MRLQRGSVRVLVAVWLLLPLTRLVRPAGFAGCDRCGAASKTNEDITRSLKRGVMRVLNGYEPPRRPWMAFIKIWRKKSEKKDKFSCGGSLLNSEWVITAGHCFCRNAGCANNSDAGNGLRVLIFLGQDDLAFRKREKKLIFRDKQIVVHPDFNPPHHDNDDVALIQLRRPAEFSPIVQPICLPRDQSLVDLELPEVFVCGWGLTVGRHCSTRRGGPSPYQMCKFPFVFQDEEFAGCSHMPTPSHYNEECVGLRRHGLHRYKARHFAGVEVRSTNGTTLTKCFKTKPNRRGKGWCATCDAKAKAGEDNFCGDDNKKGKPEYARNWGWCSASCFRHEHTGYTTILQEAALSTLSESECKLLGAVMNVDTRTELCAGRKERHKPFRVVIKRSNESYTLLTETNKDEDNFFLGGSDSCQGDSGGPLFRIQNDKAVLLGIVSRGRGCGAFQQAGVYTRVKSKMDFIEKHVNSGTCPGERAESKVSP